MFEGLKIGSDSGVLKELDAEAGRRLKSSVYNRQHALCIGIRLRNRGVRLESRHSIEAEVPKKCFVPVELQRLNDGRIQIEKSEILWHHSDDLFRFSVDPDSPPDNRPIAAKPLAPESIGENHRIRTAGRIVVPVEGSAQQRMNAQRLDHAVRHVE